MVSSLRLLGVTLTVPFRAPSCHPECIRFAQCNPLKKSVGSKRVKLREESCYSHRHSERSEESPPLSTETPCKVGSELT